ncbi:MAG: hypothetical protein N3A38_12920, partial [Planctomycetota bacterium]|nr:hypothetical protein [Planctomycetota bacterium]
MRHIGKFGRKRWGRGGKRQVWEEEFVGECGIEVQEGTRQAVGDGAERVCLRCSLKGGWCSGQRNP